MIAARDFNALIFGVYQYKILCTIVCGIIDLLKFIYNSAIQFYSLKLRNPKSCYLALILLLLPRTIIYFYSLKRLSIAVPAEFWVWVRGSRGTVAPLFIFAPDRIFHPEINMFYNRKGRVTYVTTCPPLPLIFFSASAVPADSHSLPEFGFHWPTFVYRASMLCKWTWLCMHTSFKSIQQLLLVDGADTFC